VRGVFQDEYLVGLRRVLAEAPIALGADGQIVRAVDPLDEVVAPCREGQPLHAVVGRLGLIFVLGALRDEARAEDLLDVLGVLIRTALVRPKVAVVESSVVGACLGGLHGGGGVHRTALIRVQSSQSDSRKIMLDTL
jgi:hypothetical protein